MSPLISVIMPAYNAEKSIQNAIKSVLNEKDADIELIVVDDGSTDKTPELVKSFSDDSRIVLLHQENSGVSAARNMGIKNAKGKYISFIDSDDTFVNGSFKKITEYLNSFDCSLLAFGYYYELYSKDKLVSTKANSVSDTLVFDCEDADKYFPYIFSSSKVLLQTSWNKVFKKSIIDDNSILFDTNLVCYENLTFIFEYLKHCNKIVFVPDILYKYNNGISGNALAKRKALNLTDNVSKCFAGYIKISEKNKFSDECNNYMYQQFFDDFVYCSKKYFDKSSASYSERKKLFVSYLNNKEFLYLKDKFFGGFSTFRIIYKLLSLKCNNTAYYLYQKKFCK